MGPLDSHDGKWFEMILFYNDCYYFPLWETASLLCTC